MEWDLTGGGGKGQEVEVNVSRQRDGCEATGGDVHLASDLAERQWPRRMRPPHPPHPAHPPYPR